MATQLQQPIYNEHNGVDYLSRNFESHYLHTPKYLDRITISQDQFDSYLSRTKRPNPPLPWGRSLSYGGFGHVELPTEPSPRQDMATGQHKGHRHYGGGGMTHPRGLPVEQYYDLTLLKRSNLRRNDQLLPSPEKSEMGKLQIQLPFPAEHPYSSHVAKFALFPSYDTPDDVRKGKLACQFQATLPATAPASAPDPIVAEKTKGHFARWEIIKPQNASEKKSLTWPGHICYQLVKGPENKRQDFYPTPPTSVLPNVPNRPPEMTLSPRTANALYNLHRSQWRTQYQDQYTGNGPQNVLKLDNFDDLYAGRGEQLRERFQNEFKPPHPLEGRNASIRNKKRKKIVTPNGTEREVTDSEDEEIEDAVRKMPWHSLAHTSFQHTTVEKLGDGVFRHHHPEFQRNLAIADGRNNVVSSLSNVGNYNRASHQPASFPEAKWVESYSTLTRPHTAPELLSSPIVNNMPSQLHEQIMTGSTKNDLYPKWFRPSTRYGRAGNRPSTAYINLQNSWSKTEAHRRFHEQFPENAPDIREKPDLRITTNERRHIIPETGLHGYYFH